MFTIDEATRLKSDIVTNFDSLKSDLVAANVIRLNDIWTLESVTDDGNAAAGGASSTAGEYIIIRLLTYLHVCWKVMMATYQSLNLFTRFYKNPIIIPPTFITCRWNHIIWNRSSCNLRVLSSCCNHYRCCNQVSLPLGKPFCCW